MVKQYQYISILEILSRLLRHPLLLDITLEQVVLYTVDFISLFGLPNMYLEGYSTITISNYKGPLPNDFVSILLVRDSNNKCMRSMTDNSYPNEDYKENRATDYTYKILNSVIVTSFKEGKVDIVYNSIPVDEQGYPKLIDNPTFLKCLEAYIKKEAFTILFDLGRISPQVLLNTQQLYHWLAGLLLSEFTIPSISEMESLKNQWCLMIAKVSEFDNGFKTLGSKEYLRTH